MMKVYAIDQPPAATRWFSCYLWLCLLPASLVAGGFVTDVLDYQPGEGFAVAFGSGQGLTNTVSVLGEPSRLTPGDFGGPVDPFAPAYLPEQLLSIGAGGSVTLAFETPIFNHPQNPHGLDFILFSNSGFNIINGDYAGGGVTDGSMFGVSSSQTELWVSADNQSYHRLDLSQRVGVGRGFPTDGLGDFRRPLDPGLAASDFNQQGYAGIRSLYDGSGGGLGIDLDWVEGATFLPWVRYVRVKVLSGRLEIDALASVRPRRASAAGMVIEEDFSQPLDQDGGWKTHGNAGLFSRDELNQRLDVTWDSSQPNSYFYRPLDLPLTKNDSFSLQFSLQIDELEIGTSPDKPFTFPIAVGLIRMKDAFRDDFYRGAGMHQQWGPRGLFEWAYHADSGFGATISSGFVSTDNQWAMQHTFPFELQAGALYQITLSYEAATQELKTFMSEDGVPLGPIHTASLSEFYGAPTEGFTDLNVDALALMSYGDQGQPSPEFAGSVLATGSVDDIHFQRSQTTGSGSRLLPGASAMELWVDASEGVACWLEKTLDFEHWETRGFLMPDQTASQRMKDLGTNDPHGFYRVHFQQP